MQGLPKKKKRKNMRNDQNSAVLMDYLLNKKEILVATPLEAAKTRRKTHYIKKILQLNVDYMNSMHDRTVQHLNGIMKRKIERPFKLKVS